MYNSYECADVTFDLHLWKHVDLPAGLYHAVSVYKHTEKKLYFEVNIYISHHKDLKNLGDLVVYRHPNPDTW